MEWRAKKLLTLRLAAKQIPGRTGRGVSLSTIWRWILHGCRGIRLESLVIGGTRYVSQEALDRFIAAQNNARDGPAPDATSQSAQDRQRQVEAELDRELA